MSMFRGGVKARAKNLLSFLEFLDSPHPYDIIHGSLSPQIPIVRIFLFLFLACLYYAAFIDCESEEKQSEEAKNKLIILNLCW